MIFFAIGILVGWLVEWVAHRYLLHNFKHRTFSRSHFSIHHRNCRQQGFYDPDYEQFPPKTMDGGLMEITLLIISVVITSPLIFVSVLLWLSLALHACAYYYLHRKSHLDVKWGKKWMPWHYDHHMGKDQNKNWGVTSPLFDYIFGTRQKYSSE